MTTRTESPVTDCVTNADPATVLPNQVREMVRVFGRHIPGGGIRPSFKDYTVAQVADDLDYALQVMRHWSDRALTAERELGRLQDDVAAFRRILGTATPEA